LIFQTKEAQESLDFKNSIPQQCHISMKSNVLNVHDNFSHNTGNHSKSVLLSELIFVRHRYICNVVRFLS
jgi:hypothetical protein